MKSSSEVIVKNNRYRLKGRFHHRSPPAPIRDADHGWKLVGVTNPRDMTYLHTYGGEAQFFEALSQGRLMATCCTHSSCEFEGTVYMPFRIHCPGCLEPNRLVDLTETARKSARIHTFMVCQRAGAFNTLDRPIHFINVEFDGVSTILMSYLSVGKPLIGLKVVPIFRTIEPTYTILDLSWVAAGTSLAALPEGFSF